MTQEEKQWADAWKKALFTDEEVVAVRVDPDPLTFFCHALVRDKDLWRRCHSWTFGTREGKPVCTSHFRSREVVWEK